jgi:hypothetical protein
MNPRVGAGRTGRFVNPSGRIRAAHVAAFSTWAGKAASGLAAPRGSATQGSAVGPSDARSPGASTHARTRLASRVVPSDWLRAAGVRRKKRALEREALVLPAFSAEPSGLGG